AFGEPRPLAASQPFVAEKPLIGVPGAPAGTLLSPTVTSLKNSPPVEASEYSFGFNAPKRPLADWSARATRPAHCGDPALVPPKPNTNVPAWPHAETSDAVQ